MMMAWLVAKSFLGAPRWIFVVIGAVALIAAGLVWWTAAENADDRRNQELGAAEERAEALEETVERVEKANDVREEINRNDDVGAELRYRQCLRSARTPANCERLLPSGQAD